jgi:hypothetical protein
VSDLDVGIAAFFGWPAVLSPSEIDDVVAFLRTLSDSAPLR